MADADGGDLGPFMQELTAALVVVTVTSVAVAAILTVLITRHLWNLL